MDLLWLIGVTMAQSVGGMMLGIAAAMAGWLCFAQVGKAQWGPMAMLPPMVALACRSGSGDLLQIAVLFEGVAGALLYALDDTLRRQEHLARLAVALGADIYSRVPPGAVRASRPAPSAAA